MTEDKIYESPIKNAENAHGYRFRHIRNEEHMLQAVHNKCKGKLKIIENKTNRMGLDAVLEITCDNCGLDYTTQSSHQTLPGHWLPRDSEDLNNRIVYAMTEMGCSKTELTTLCEILDLPVAGCSPTMWKNRVETIKEAVKKCANSVLEANRRELFNYYELDDQNRLVVPVTYDGTWMTRGWSSSVGVGFVLSVDTGKPLDFPVRVNYCQICRFCKYKKGSKNTSDGIGFTKTNANMIK